MQTITIGRSNTNDVILSDMTVSRQHAQIVRSDYGGYSITDLNSRNGTFVNGQRIFGTAALRENDVVRIGDSTLAWRQYFVGYGATCAPNYGNGGYVPLGYGNNYNMAIPQQPPQQSSRTNVFAILGFIFAFFPILHILGFSFSIIGLSQAGKLRSGRGLAIPGLILSIIGILVVVIIFLVWFFD